MVSAPQQARRFGLRSPPGVGGVGIVAAFACLVDDAENAALSYLTLVTVTLRLRSITASRPSDARSGGGGAIGI